MQTPRSREDWRKKDPRHEDHNHNHPPVHREHFQDHRNASWRYRSCLKRENTVRYTSNKRKTGKSYQWISSHLPWHGTNCKYFLRMHHDDRQHRYYVCLILALLHPSNPSGNLDQAHRRRRYFLNQRRKGRLSGVYHLSQHKILMDPSCPTRRSSCPRRIYEGKTIEEMSSLAMLNPIPL